MSKGKQNKKALALSVISIVLCLAMLIGTTLAWFTDSASTLVSGIKTGNLDIALEMKVGDDWVDAEGKLLSFIKAGGAPIDEEDLWEPGVTYRLPELRVVNKGDLALRYKLSVTDVLGDTKLLEAIDFTYGGINIGEEATLLPRQSIEGIVIEGHMREDVGNAYQGLSISAVSIRADAAQAAHEYDSYNNQYDAGADYASVPALIDETQVFTITVAEGGGTLSDIAEIRVPSDAVAVDTEATFTIKRTDADANSVTYEISLTECVSCGPIVLTQPATITINVGTGLNITSVFHGENAMTMDVGTDNLTDQEFWYDENDGKLYLCTATFSPFTVTFSGRTIGEEENERELIFAHYLSDIPYDEDRTVHASKSNAWGIITMDKTADSGAPLSLRVNGEVVTFRKGIFAHAPSTVVYDLTEYNYDYFATYYGVSSLRGGNGSVKFFIYTSMDGETWELQNSSDTSTVYTGATNAGYLKIALNGAKYLKLVADHNGNNGQDHAVYGDAKLFNEGYTESVTPPKESYDEKVKTAGVNIVEGSDAELALLQREFVRRVGDYTLRNFIEVDPEKNQDVLNWLMNDQEMLRLYLVGGKPEGTYLKSLEVLRALYDTHKADLDIDTETQYGTRLGDLYRTMMLAISLTHSGNVYLWVDGDLLSDPVERYEIYKDLHSEGLIECEIFESLTVEEMRWVMNTVIDDEEIKWLNWYVRSKNGATSPYSYIRYTFGYNYALAKYYDPANYDSWEAKYNLKDEDWDITYQTGFPKLWIVFEEGSVCGGLSKTGSCIWGAYKGLPNTCVCQPVHCAYIYYVQVNGQGVWYLGNDVSGWSTTGRTEHLNVRIMNDWGNDASGWTASYVLLAQGAQNEYDKYEAAEVTMMLEDVYKDDPVMLEQVYRKAIDQENINFDAWTGLVNLYLADSNRTESEYYALAEQIANIFTYYPRPMTDLLAKIEPKLTSPAVQAQFSMLKTRVLTLAANATDAQTLQKQACRQIAQSLLGVHDGTIATFSFDGDNAGQIVLGNKFEGSDVAWDYSLDGGTTWTQVTEHSKQLSDEELTSITADNDIKVHIIGVDYSEGNVYTIDILASAGIPATVYANDRENRIFGTTDAMQWRFSDTEPWTFFKDDQPDLSGSKTVLVRVAWTGVYQASGTKTYTFTPNNDPAEKTYIPIEKLSIHSFSSETEPTTDKYKRNELAAYAIDGNINTMWHNSHYSEAGVERWIVIQLSEPMYLSALEYQPKLNYTWGIIKTATISVSMDAENWTVVGTTPVWAKNTNAKTVELDATQKALYVKLEVTEGHDAHFVNAAMINLFQDTTKP